MIPLQIEIISYDKETNDCQAKLQNGNIITLDPFVGCSLQLDDEEYKLDYGFNYVGKTYLMKEYTVHHTYVVPHEFGLIEL
jgi:hypothetical protein